jgi:hypothetical protein
VTSVHQLKVQYGLEPDDIAKQLVRQGGRCCLCRKPFTRGRPYAVDHNHETGLWRGLLCIPCNHELGFRHDDAGWFRRAADYLDYPPTLADAVIHYVPGSAGEAGVLDDQRT